MSTVLEVLAFVVFLYLLVLVGRVVFDWIRVFDNGFTELSGKVTELLVRDGDKVSAGQVLARVEPDGNQAQTLSQVRS